MLTPALSAPFSSSDEMVPLMGAVRSVSAAMLRLGPDHPDVEDCTSETMRRAVEGRARLRPGEPLRPWLLGIARHVALDMLRARKRRGNQRALDVPDDEGPPAVERVPDSTAPADDLLQRAREREQIRDALATLPDAMSTALTRFHLDGKSYQEIARELDVPLGTVATWVARGRKALIERLGPKGIGA